MNELLQGISDILESAENDTKAIGIPKETCPKIDYIIRELKDAERNLSFYVRNCNRYETAEELAEALPEFPDVLGELEELRDSNNRLRTLGILWHEAARKICELVEENQEEMRGGGCEG